MITVNATRNKTSSMKGFFLLNWVNQRQLSKQINFRYPDVPFHIIARWLGKHMTQIAFKIYKPTLWGFHMYYFQNCELKGCFQMERRIIPLFFSIFLILWHMHEMFIFQINQPLFQTLWYIGPGIIWIE